MNSSTAQNDARLAHLAKDCDGHAMQAKLTDPDTGQARWACEGCGADCGAAE
jgi:hypothetical protein